MIGLAITEDASLRSFAGILSSPVALHDFSFDSSWRTKLALTSCRVKSLLTLGAKILCNVWSLNTLHRFFAIDEKNLLKFAADIVSDPPDADFFCLGKILFSARHISFEL